MKTTPLTPMTAVPHDMNHIDLWVFSALLRYVWQSDVRAGNILTTATGKQVNLLTTQRCQVAKEKHYDITVLEGNWKSWRYRQNDSGSGPIKYNGRLTAASYCRPALSLCEIKHHPKSVDITNTAAPAK